MQRDRRKELDIVGNHSSNYLRQGISIKVIKKARKCVCRLRLSSGKLGTGFFGVLECGDKIYKGLFTCNHLIVKNDLRFGNKFIVETDSNALELEVQGFWFTDDDLDATFIELTKEQIRRLKVSDFLPMDYSLEQGDTIFLMQCPRNDDIRFASGVTVVDNEDENMFYHNCDTDRGSSGSPLLNQDGEVLGIHCGVDRDSERNYAVRIAAVRNAIKKKLANTDSDERRRSAGRRELKQTVQELRQQQERQALETLVIKQKLQQQEQQLQEQQKQKSQNKQSKHPKADGKTARPKIAINVKNSNTKLKLSKF